MNLIEPILADTATIQAIRRDIHAHPELCFQEQRTADVIAKALTDWGIPVHRGLGTTGVVGWPRPSTSASTATSTAPCTWCSSRPKKGAAVRAR